MEKGMTMNINKKLLSTTVALSAAIAFASAPISSALANNASAQVKCYGVNGCKGQADCKSAKNDCKGQNGCKGQGYKVMSKPDCKKAGGKVGK